MIHKIALGYYGNLDCVVFLAFSLASWKTNLGLSGPTLEVHYIRQLLHDMGVATYLKDSSSKCDWSQPPYSTADANGWTDSKKKGNKYLPLE